VVTDLDALAENEILAHRGYTIRHIEAWHRDGTDESCVVWDAPQIAEGDLPF
jgi:hypothetical protein